MRRIFSALMFTAMAALCGATAAQAEWRAANPSVQAAAADPRIAGLLDTVNEIDAALVAENAAAFAALLADDLAVNNPRNQVFSRERVAGGAGAGGFISYEAYVRNVEYIGLRGDMVVLMGEERVIPRPPNPQAGQTVTRRFTDLWKQQDGRWLLTARQATIIDAR